MSRRINELENSDAFFFFWFLLYRAPENRAFPFSGVSCIHVPSAACFLFLVCIFLCVCVPVNFLREFIHRRQLLEFAANIYQEDCGFAVHSLFI